MHKKSNESTVACMLKLFTYSQYDVNLPPLALCDNYIGKEILNFDNMRQKRALVAMGSVSLDLIIDMVLDTINTLIQAGFYIVINHTSLETPLSIFD